MTQDPRNAEDAPEAQDGPVYFWRETHPLTGYLSQWYACPFRDPGEPSKTYKTAEHYMMHQKALLFDDPATGLEILRAEHPRQAKSLGRRVRAFDQRRWDAERLRVVARGNYLKFAHPAVPGGVESLRLGTGWGPGGASSEAAGSPLVGAGGLRARLLATGGRELVEASPFDRVWGIGYREEHAEGVGREDWGENLLGRALMEVREIFRKEDEEERAGAEGEKQMQKKQKKKA
ncbi:uncharacterized protein E0L32_003871 [Thyridium curvatum]|uniref:NADAR domain-containing protein n=1 Tax=Thyridium curvatum TaxID=1093900 RepID=A0A507B9Q3_9PEZI|nr:uncharacterized protein E0L32_003871 [Thyridium curvatum]TPX16577.1 hypothetical protein E0L32_003871 [Thyridium curvatum]